MIIDDCTYLIVELCICFIYCISPKPITTTYNYLLQFCTYRIGYARVWWSEATSYHNCTKLLLGLGVCLSGFFFFLNNKLSLIFIMPKGGKRSFSFRSLTERVMSWCCSYSLLLWLTMTLYTVSVFCTFKISILLYLNIFNWEQYF